MKKRYLVPIFILAIIFAIMATSLIALNLYDRFRVHNLNLSFDSPNGKIHISRMEVTPGTVLKMADTVPSIEVLSAVKMTATKNTENIEKVIDYLNSIPLKYVKEGEDFDYPGGADIFFYDKNDVNLGIISISDDNYIHDSRRAITYKLADDNICIISGLENLELE